MHLIDFMNEDIKKKLVKKTYKKKETILFLLSKKMNM